MVQEEKHLLKVADGRVESPERDVNKGKWEMIQLLPYILNGGRDVEFVKHITYLPRTIMIVAHML